MTAKNARSKRRCQRKITYRHESDAAASAHQLGITWYQCRFCGAWHTGHMPHKARRAIRDKLAAQRKASGQ